MSFQSKFRGFSAYKQDEQGNVAMIAALSVIPVLSVCGMAIDLQMTNTSRNQVQAAIDAAVVAGAKMLQSGANTATIEEDVQNYVDALLKQSSNGGLSCGQVDVDVNIDSEVIDAAVRCTQETTLSAVYGKDEMAFTISSGSTYGLGKVEVAFVFDVSGSMKGDKIDDLQDAAQDAVDMILPDVQGNSTSSSDDVRIAMVSYDDAVNAGSYFEAVTGLKKNRTVEVEQQDRSCEWVSTGGSSKSWKKKKGGGSKGYWDCEDTTETEEISVSGTCVVERIGPHMLDSSAPDNLDGDGWVEAQFYPETDKRGDPTGDYISDDCTEQEILPLTSNGEKLEKYIDDLKPRGRTAGHLGIAWGWYMLSPDWDDVWPNRARPEVYDASKVTKAIIMMTDGEFNEFYSEEYGSSNDWADAYCDEIKENGIVIYTVAFEAPDDAKDVLKACATSEDHAFEAKSGAELKAAYKKIAQSISDLRIAY